MLTFLEEVGDYLGSLFDTIVEILLDFGEALIKGLQWFFVKVISFVVNIVDYFERLAYKYENDPDLVGFGYLIDQEMQAGNATVIKGILRNKNSAGAFVKGIYNKRTKKILNKDLEVNEFNTLDKDTEEQLAGNRVLIIE